jgi:hypothetical protein
MSTETKFTPGPLAIGPAHVVRRVFNLPAPDGRRCTQFIAEFFSTPGPDGFLVDGHANASRMVLTWNCHDDLVSALRDLTDAIDDGLCNSGVPGFDADRLDRAMVSAREALAKAGRL